MYNVENKRGRYLIKDQTNKNQVIAFSKSKKKAISFSQNLLVTGFEGFIPGFMFSGNPINLDSKKDEDNVYST